MPPLPGDADAWKQVMVELIARSTQTAPTVPGVYRMPCGNCYVDFFVTTDGTERWLVPGDDRSYTRETVAIARHGDYPWERMYTLAQASREIRRLAAETGSAPGDLLAQHAAIATRRVRPRTKR